MKMSEVMLFRISEQQNKEKKMRDPLYFYGDEPYEADENAILIPKELVFTDIPEVVSVGAGFPASCNTTSHCVAPPVVQDKLLLFAVIPVADKPVGIVQVVVVKAAIVDQVLKSVDEQMALTNTL